MKTLKFFAVAGLFSLNLSAQDTLFTRNGEVIQAKVVEIGTNEIKYRKPSNPDGPLYIVSKSDITLIEYKNGSKDVFQTDPNLSYNTDNSGQAAGNSNQSGTQPQNPVYVNPGPAFNVVVGAAPFYYSPWNLYGGWGRWGGWGWGGIRRSYAYGGYHNHGGYHYGHRSGHGGGRHR